MSEVATATAGPASVLVVVPTGRNGWVTRTVTLHYEGSRLVKAEGIAFTQVGPLGLTGTLYKVKDTFRRDDRTVLRLERQNIVNGKVVGSQNWGEIDDAGPRAA